MNEETIEQIKTELEKLADELKLQLISVNYLPNGEMGKTLEVIIDDDYHISMDQIEEFTTKANPILDEIVKDDEAYMLDISSGGSLREIPFADLEKLKDHYLDVKIKKSGETITCKILSLNENECTFFYFIKGKKTKLTLKENEIESIHMGYKA